MNFIIPINDLENLIGIEVFKNELSNDDKQVLDEQVLHLWLVYII